MPLNPVLTGSTFVQLTRRKIKRAFKSLDLKGLFGSKYSCYNGLLLQ